MVIGDILIGSDESGMNLCLTSENLPSPDVGRLCVIVPLCTENRLRFSAALEDGALPEVRFERVAAS
jgi:hypothetical protein